jgi:SAM-dependent methyltransferase
MGRTIVSEPVVESSPSVVENLSPRRHWDEVHQCEREELRHWSGSEPPASRRWKKLLKPLLGDDFRALLANYDHHILWDVLYEKYLPRRPGALAVEIGSAPGEHLCELHRRFGLEPFGIEYSDSGAALNRDLFRRAGVRPSNVLHADFFSEAVSLQYRDAFDVVISRGFIEHFDDAKSVVARHVELLAPGGTLVITIPNLRGVNKALTWLFDPSLLPMHNLAIMNRSAFAALFDGFGLSTVFCDYFGIFNFSLFGASPGSIRERALHLCTSTQPLLNLAFRSLRGDRGAESRFFSPNLAYIGVKQPPAPSVTQECQVDVAAPI